MAPSSPEDPTRRDQPSPDEDHTDHVDHEGGAAPSYDPDEDPDADPDMQRSGDGS